MTRSFPFLASAASAQPAPLVFSTGFGLLMTVAATVAADGRGSITAAAAVMVMLIGLLYRWVATLSVLLIIAVIVVSDPPALFAALSGLSAAAYLVLRHASGAGIVTMTRPTVIGMIAFTVIGIVATTTPLSLPWLPLLAPPAVVVMFVLVILPFVTRRRSDPGISAGGG